MDVLMLNTLENGEERITELKGKLQIKEKALGAFIDGTRALKSKNETLIQKLTTDNKDKRHAVARGIASDKRVIQSVFYDRKEERLSMDGYTADKAIYTMDQKRCEATTRLNSLQYEAAVKAELLAELKHQEQQYLTLMSGEYNPDMQQNYRRLENELDKTRLKFETASNISAKYEMILNQMQEECQLYPTLLDSMEKELHDARTELAEIKDIAHSATLSSEEARARLRELKYDIYPAKKARDQELMLKRKEVEKIKHPDRTEKVQMPVVGENKHVTTARLLALGKRHVKILKLKYTVNDIKDIINVSDIKDVLARMQELQFRYECLQRQKDDKLSLQDDLKEELDNLKLKSKKQYYISHQSENEKYTQEGLEDDAEKEEKRWVDTVAKMRQTKKLLFDTICGINTIFEKLRNVKLKPPLHNYSNGDPVEDITNCQRKIQMLLTYIEEENPEHCVDKHKLYEYMENNLDPDNIRIQISNDDNSDNEAFLFYNDDDGDSNEGLVTREDIKKLAREIQKSKTVFKKKKRKSRVRTRK